MLMTGNLATINSGKTEELLQ